MNADLQLVSRLQTIDQRIAELDKDIKAMPAHIASIEKTLDHHKRKLDVDRAALAANQKERKKLDDDVIVQQQKISKLREQMMGAKTNEQYRAFQNEIDYCQKEIRRCEDRSLELMTESEPLSIAVKKAEAALTEEKKVVDGEKAKASERLAQDKKWVEQCLAEKAEIARELNPVMLKAYERVRKKAGRIVLADATNGRCGACQIGLRPQYFQELRKGDQILFCESCGRFLFYNPPVSFEGESPAPASGVTA